MIEVRGEVPELRGRVCEGVRLQQYVHRGDLVDDANVLFLKPAGMAWQRFFFDGGVLFWREVAEPDAPSSDLADEHHYPIMDVGAPNQLAGKRIGGVRLEADASIVRLPIDYTDGACLTLENDAHDVSHIVVRSAA